MRATPILLFAITFLGSILYRLVDAFVQPTTISNGQNPILAQQGIRDRIPMQIQDKLGGDDENSFRASLVLDETESNEFSEQELQITQPTSSQQRRNLLINAVAIGLLGVSGVASYSLYQTSLDTPAAFRRLPRTQFIAALGNPTASAGTEATSWGLWEEDPGPRGVWLRDYQRQIVATNNQAPAGWSYDPNNWWLEEHGLIMEAPKFPLKEGRYLVTGGRLVTTGLTITSYGQWKLDEGTLYDVTHLPCRSARYQPQPSFGDLSTLGTPLSANPGDFPVTPGAAMPDVKGCSKQDYAVLFVVGKADKA